MSVAIPTCDFRSYFDDVEDPRIDRTKDHQLTDILFICVAATVAGADGPTDIEEFAKEKLAWCRRFVPLKNGVPSHDTIGRVLAVIKPDQFQKAFLDWVVSFASECDEEENERKNEPRFVPIDGKTLRGSKGAKHRSEPLHVVSAWATRQGLTLGQVAVDSKSNEITAIPKLLQMLELAGAIVSIDAMGCQKEIAKQIVKEGGDYVLAVKDNQPTLSEAIREFFLQRHENDDFREHDCRQHTTTERSRGRIEERYYSIAPVSESMKGFCRDFKGLKSIGQVVTQTTHGKKQTSDVRYYISSRHPKVKEFAKSTRGHWSIESMHWILDVVLNEDLSRIRNGDGTENFGFLRKFVISLLKQDTSRGSLKGKRKRAGWNTQFLEKLLFG
jgi:predicted transposase YbfD/YdcC